MYLALDLEVRFQLGILIELIISPRHCICINMSEYLLTLELVRCQL